MDPRKATRSRKTNETEIRVSLNLDGTGEYQIGTGIPFFDHMLAQLARHGHFDLEISAKGDLEIDGHHTVEDVGWVLGQAFREAGGDRRGIVRFAHAYVPLDEALTRVVIDLSGRPYLIYKVEFRATRIGDLQTELIGEFLNAVVQEGLFMRRVENLYGRNQHDVAESVCKATALALRVALRVEHRQVPSTRGVL